MNATDALSVIVYSHRTKVKPYVVGARKERKKEND